MLLKRPKKRKCKNCQKDFTAVAPTRRCQKCKLIPSTVRRRNNVYITLKTANKKPKIKKESRKKLVKELDEVFSIYIRQREMDKDGFAICAPCGVKKHWKELQNGHYISRSHYSTRWSEKNCWPSCVSCNIFKSGNYPAYTEFLIKRFGQTWLLNLIKEGNMILKWTTQELKEQINFYKNKIK